MKPQWVNGRLLEVFDVIKVVDVLRAQFEFSIYQYPIYQ